MDDPLLVRVLDAVAELDEQLEPLADRQTLTVAVARDRLALYVLHRKVRPPFGRGPPVEDFGNGGVVHDCERLALCFEARHHLRRVHPCLHDLNRDLAANRTQLFGEHTSPIPPSPSRCRKRYGPNPPEASDGLADVRVGPLVGSGSSARGGWAVMGEAFDRRPNRLPPIDARAWWGAVSRHDRRSGEGGLDRARPQSDSGSKFLSNARYTSAMPPAPTWAPTS